MNDEYRNPWWKRRRGGKSALDATPRYWFQVPLTTILFLIALVLVMVVIYLVAK